MLLNILGRGYSAAELIVTLLTYALALIIALTMHEYAHAWMALKQGDPSAKMAGRLTINPARHFDPLGLLCMLLVGFGWAKPVPVNPFNYRNFRRGNFLVSIAGITVNFILGILFSLGFYLFAAYGDPTSIWAFMGYSFFLYGMLFNFIFMVFNLLPIPPLDGYNMLVSVTKPNNGFMKFMRENGFVFLILVILFAGYVVTPIAGFISDIFVKFWGLMF